MLVHTGHGISYHYTNHGTSLPRVQEHKDLGVMTTMHCNAVAVKGFRALLSLR